MTEQLERKQRRKRKVKQKHLEQLASTCAHEKEVLAANRAQQARCKTSAKEQPKVKCDPL